LVEEALDVGFVRDLEAGYALDGHGGDVGRFSSRGGLERDGGQSGMVWDVSMAVLFRSSLLENIPYVLSGISDMDGPPSSPTTYAPEIVHDVLHSPGGVGEAWLLSCARRWNASHTKMIHRGRPRTVKTCMLGLQPSSTYGCHSKSRTLFDSKHTGAREVHVPVKATAGVVGRGPTFPLEPEVIIPVMNLGKSHASCTTRSS